MTAMRAAESGRQGQHPAVLQQHDSLARYLQRNLVVRGHIRCGGGAPSVDSDGEHRTQDPPDHVRQALFGKPAVGVGGAQSVGERLGLPQDGVDLRTALLVEAVERALPARCATPIGHDPTAVSPSAFQHVIDQDVVRRGVVTVDLVVGRHHGAGLCPLDGDLEGQQVGFAVRVGIDDRVQPVPVGLVAVQRVVLDRRDHTLRLYPVDRLRGHRGAQKRVFRKVFEVAAVARVARQVHRGRQLDVESAAAGLPADRLAGGTRQRRVEAAGQRQRAGQRCRGVTRDGSRGW